MTSNKKQKGFTLIELMFVIATIGLLSSIVISALSDSKVKSRDSARINTLIGIRTALQLYNTDKSGYPSNNKNDFAQTLVNGKYIPFINSTGIFYEGLNINGTRCKDSKTCYSYHMATALELGANVNKALNTDKDSNNPTDSNKIYGESTNCTSDNNGPERCYDIEP